MQQMQKLKLENEKMRAENRALTRKNQFSYEMRIMKLIVHEKNMQP